jgi:uncharacterized protein YuzE
VAGVFVFFTPRKPRRIRSSIIGANEAGPRNGSEMSDTNDGMIVVEHTDKIPRFANEDEERAYWDTHTLAPHVFTERGPRQGGLAERLSKERFKPHVVVSKEADAAYVYLHWGRPTRSEKLDERRIADYAGNGELLGVCFLQVSSGIRIDDLTERDKIRAILRDHKPPLAL